MSSGFQNIYLNVCSNAKNRALVSLDFDEQLSIYNYEKGKLIYPWTF